MLELKGITKVYYNRKDASKSVTALRKIDIKFPKQGLVSILGPSGCGKTTLLNILGGLDNKYDGKFIVNGVDTKDFKAKDWDAYRNNHVGFVFQEYNLIQHQSVTKNVELVLTIAGAPKIQRDEKTKKVLSDVGLQDKMMQQPNSLSGGQKQRVAIARALVNDPELILADEPTSALDTKTSAQIMEILKEISKTKLVIMVTHNVELAKKYSSRIINILDGEVKSDEDFEKSEEKEEFMKKLPQSYKYGKSKMKFSTAAALSYKNLLGKKRRTILTILAGCIGIICLSVILGIINGSVDFAKQLNNNALKRQPYVINRRKDVHSVGDAIEDMNEAKRIADEEANEAEQSDEIRNPASAEKRFNEVVSKRKNRKLNILNKEFQTHVLSLLDRFPTGIESIEIPRNERVKFLLKDSKGKYKQDSYSFSEMPYSNTLQEQYDLMGENSRWPTKRDEVIVALDEYNHMPTDLMRSLGLVEKDSFKVEEVLGREVGCFVPYNEMYIERGKGNFSEISTEEELKKAYDSPNSIKLKIVGVVKPKRDEGNSKGIHKKFRMFMTRHLTLNRGIVYTRELGDYIEENVKNSNIVKAQKESSEPVLASMERQNRFMFNDDLVAKKPNEKEKMQRNLEALGYSENARAIYINIKNPVDDKQKIIDYLKTYNEGKSEDQTIELRDTEYSEQFVNDIRTVCLFLILTVGLASLIVSLIMVGILEFVSVLERTREIGILKSIGARKKDISNLFKAESLIIGLFTGLVGVGIGFLISIPLNIWVRTGYDLGNTTLISVDFKILIALTLFSLVVTLLAGLIPAGIASRKDPVKILTGSNN